MKKILVADDNFLIRNLLKTLLASNGYSVILAKDGLEAFDLVVENKPDLIILDIMMPKSDGIETLYKLKSMPELSGIPVIMLTAKSTIFDLKVSQSIGAIDHVTKPFKPKELLWLVKKILDE